MIAGTTDTIPPAAEQEAELIRRQTCRRAVHLIVMGHRDLALDMVRAGFVEQADVLGIDTEGQW